MTGLEPVAWRGEVCSSSRIRAAVAAGEMALAHDLLGQPFVVDGRVVAGDRRGRELGYPTANLRSPGQRALWPPPGIYAVRAGWRDGDRLSTTMHSNGITEPSARRGARSRSDPIAAVHSRHEL